MYLQKCNWKSENLYLTVLFAENSTQSQKFESFENWASKKLSF